MGSKRGFGTIRKLPSGKHQARYTGPDLGVHRAPTTFTTKASAEAWLVDERKLIEAGTWTAPAVRKAAVAAAPLTLTAYAGDWLASRPLKPRTRIEYRRLLDGVVLPSLGAMPVPAMTPAVVRSWYASLDATKPTRRSHAYGLLRSVLSTAVEDEILLANPCRIRGAGQTSRAREIRPPSAAELTTIIEATPERYRLMVELAAWCGLRFGELAALRRGDLQLGADGMYRVHVRRGAVRVDGVTVIGDPKSRAGLRTVVLPPAVNPAVVRHLGGFVTGRDGLLFPTPGGQIMTGGNQLNAWWHPARSAAGRSDLRFHDLRHHGATRAAEAGATLVELQQRLGHSTVAAALRYQHVTSGRDADLARRMSGQ